MDSLSNDINCATTDYGKLYTSMPVLEDGLSSGHASDTENNVSVVCYQQPQTQSQQAQQQQQQQQVILEHNGNSDGERLQTEYSNSPELGTLNTETTDARGLQPSDFVTLMPTSSPPPLPESPTATPSPQHCEEPEAEVAMTADSAADNNSPAATHYGPVYAAAATSNKPSPSPSSATAAVAAEAAVAAAATATSPVEIQEAMKEIRSAIQRAKAQPDKLKYCDEVLPADPDSPVWVPRKTATATRVDEEEADTDLETDRLLGQQDFFGEQVSSVYQNITKINCHLLSTFRLS